MSLKDIERSRVRRWDEGLICGWKGCSSSAIEDLLPSVKEVRCEANKEYLGPDTFFCASPHGEELEEEE